MGRPAPVVGHAALLLRTRVGVGPPSRHGPTRRRQLVPRNYCNASSCATIQELLGMFRRQELPIVFTELGSRAADGRDLPPFRRALLAGR